MSILDEIERRCNERPAQLFPVQPVDDLRADQVPMSERRAIYVSPEIRAFLDSNDALAGNTHADLDAFILGRPLNVALEPDHQDCLLARLDEASDEVWEIRIYDYQTPQLRFFGRFAEQDVFVALIGPVSRRKLWWKRFEAIKKTCKAQWQGLFGSHPPVNGGNDVHAYISKNVTII
jgi:hypothetical protein